MKITLEGERHLVAVIGSIKFREQYVINKVNGWIKDTQDLADIGKETPHLAYAAFTKGLAHRWTFVQEQNCKVFISLFVRSTFIMQ